MSVLKVILVIVADVSREQPCLQLPPLYPDLRASPATAAEKSTYSLAAVLAPTCLHAGENVLAVEVHDADLDPTDLRFDAQVSLEGRTRVEFVSAASRQHPA